MSTQNESRTLLWIVVGGGAFFLFLLAVFTLVYVAARGDDSTEFGSFGDRIAVVEIDGVILDVRDLVQTLKRYGDDRSVKAIVLHLNTPGGGVAASQEVYQMVRRLREQKKKRVVAFIESVGASGGYYIAAASSQIYAEPGSIVGSIGVIAQWVNYGELLKWAKLKDVTFKAGEYKDVGSPTRDLTPAEQAYLQALIDDMHGQFISAVAAGRKMKEEDVRSIADGKVWTGAQAMELKLVDELGDLQTAIEATAKAVGIKGDPVVVRPSKERRTVLDLLFSDVSEFVPSKAKLLETHPGFYYLWK